MAKHKKYSDIHITPTGNGHMVTVHRPMQKSEGAMPTDMESGKDDGLHYDSADKAADHARGIMAAHDGKGMDEMAPEPMVKEDHPLNRMKRKR